MNALIVGTNKQPLIDFFSANPRDFLLIDDGPIIDAISVRARVLDLDRHTFNPIRKRDYKRARQIASAIYDASPQGENTLTVRNGKRALAKLFFENPTRLDRLPFDRSDAHQEAKGMLDDLFLSPVLKQFLCGEGEVLPMKGTLVARLNRAELGDEDCFVIGNILMSFYQGQIVVPDFGFYGCPFHVSLIRQERLIAGVNALDEKPELRSALLSIPDIIPSRCTAEDAEALADYCCGFPRGTDGYASYVQRSMA